VFILASIICCSYWTLKIFVFVQVTDRTVVCSAHFKDGCFIRKATHVAKRRLLLPSAVPTEFEWTKKVKSRRIVIRQPTSRATDEVVDSDSERTLTAGSVSDYERNSG
jgi:hypothetical protein